MRKTNSLPILIFFFIFGVGLAFAYSSFLLRDNRDGLSIAAGSAVIAFVISYSVKVADQWERVVVLRLGRFRDLKGPGLFFIIPIIESSPIGSTHA